MLPAYTTPERTTIVGPDGNSKMLLNNNPAEISTALNIADKIIFVRRCEAKHAADALGNVNKAITSMIPTRLISRTIVNAVRIRSPKYRTVTFIPLILANVSSNVSASNAGKKIIVGMSMIASRTSVIARSSLVSSRILPNK